ncbi:hypothetical protein [Schlesneria sp. T3-172]|uniref:hypothetical protein n=1 Tax=Schlesneria sphaerica TaxID=3373610 RepID=UPI0037CC1BF4
MRSNLRSQRGKLTGFLVLTVMSTFCIASSTAASGQPEPMTRIVWQDRDRKTLMWGDLVKAGASLILKPGGPVHGFPKLDKERHELVQMERIGNFLLVGVRDDDSGQFLSGWVAIDLGVDEMPHGDHSDFTYRSPPQVLASVLDQSQGNPAHLYVYDKAFYLANDSLSGYTRLTPAQLTGPADQRKGTFHRGGGAHITLAAVDHKVGYGTWIPGGGPDKGRIDVSDLTKTGDDSIAYTFHLPVGGLHGAVANSGRIFFAPSDGVYWVDADLELKQKAETVVINHLSLGKDKDSDRPLRTGAFTNHRNWVLFTTGALENSALCLLDAAAPQPAIVTLPISVSDGLSLVTPEAFATAGGKRYAFVFQNRKEGAVQEKLTIVDLDPNGDRDFADAAISKTIDVGPSRVEGHYGHHTISVDDDAKFGLISNPGSGEVWLLSLAELKIVGKYKVGGMPTKLIVVGGEESKH